MYFCYHFVLQYFCKIKFWGKQSLECHKKPISFTISKKSSQNFPESRIRHKSAFFTKILKHKKGDLFTDSPLNNITIIHDYRSL